jgi:hypothetical protein
VKTLNDVTCHRCKCTMSCMWVDPADVIASHVCPDGGRSDSISVTERVVPGPGERGKDDEVGRG